MECFVAAFVHALDASTSLALITHGTGQPPSSRRYPMKLGDRLQELNTAEPDLRDPQSTNDVGPTAVVCALDGAAAYRTHAARDVVGNAGLTSPTQPLALGNVRYAVALLVNGKVTRITEQNCVDVCAFVVTAYCTNGVVV